MVRFPAFKLGVLGGMGPLATVTFYAELVRRTPANIDQQHLPVLLDVDPAIPDRTAFLLGQGEDPRPRLRQVARRLAASGATHLVMPCNTANVFADDVEHAAGRPVIRWLDLAASAIAAGGELPVALLATTGTVSSGVYQQRFDRLGVDWMVPPAMIQARITEIIYGTEGVKMTSIATSWATEAFAEVVEQMGVLGARSVFLACTELPIVARRADMFCGLQVLDPAEVVAEHVVELSLGEMCGTRHLV